TTSNRIHSPQSPQYLTSADKTIRSMSPGRGVSYPGRLRLRTVKRWATGTCL
ncbi:unnamed protein product, partial [Mycena citricolor]